MPFPYMSRSFRLTSPGTVFALAILVASLFCEANVAVAKDSDEQPESSGTGLVVNRQGHVLTNYYVVDGCVSIRATIDGKPKELAIVGIDAKDDLAVLKFHGQLPAVATFRVGKGIRPGDSIVVVGFPLYPFLASEANVTTGTVSALAGLGNDARFLQMTAPVQLGNSGGPLLDQSGLVVGVVVSKLNALMIARDTGDIPQNVNFAISSAVSKAFLDDHHIDYETPVAGRKLEAADVGEQAKLFTLLLQCYAETFEDRRRRLEADRQAKATERRAAEERRAQAAAHRAEEEARERALEVEKKELARKAQIKDEADRQAAEYKQREHEKELARTSAMLAEEEANPRARPLQQERARASQSRS
jgi:hypothetical protein